MTYEITDEMKSTFDAAEYAVDKLAYFLESKIDDAVPMPEGYYLGYHHNVRNSISDVNIEFHMYEIETDKRVFGCNFDFQARHSRDIDNRGELEMSVRKGSFSSSEASHMATFVAAGEVAKLILTENRKLKELVRDAMRLVDAYCQATYDAERKAREDRNAQERAEIQALIDEMEAGAIFENEKGHDIEIKKVTPKMAVLDTYPVWSHHHERKTNYRKHELAYEMRRFGYTRRR